MFVPFFLITFATEITNQGLINFKINSIMDMKTMTFDELITQIKRHSIFSKAGNDILELKRVLDKNCDKGIYEDFFNYMEKHKDNRDEVLSRNWLIETLSNVLTCRGVEDEFGLVDGKKRLIKSIKFDLVFKDENSAEYMGVKFDKVHHIELNNYKDTPLTNLFASDDYDDAETWSSIDKGLQRIADFQIWYNIDSPLLGIQMQIVPCEFNQESDEWFQNTSMSMDRNLEFTCDNLQIITDDNVVIKC